MGKALSEFGDLTDHISHPMRGAGVGRGGGRFVTLQGAMFLAVFFRLISGGVPAVLSVNIAQKFVFLGETGNGLRAFKPGKTRPAGEVFPSGEDTFLVAIANAQSPEKTEGDGFAFVPGSDLNAQALTEWLGLQEADKSPVCIFNLSEVCRDIRAGLASHLALQVSADTTPDLQPADWSKLTSDPLGAFLADCAARDDKARTPTQEFFRAFAAWYSGWTGKPRAEASGSRADHAALQADLLALGIRKVKSNGIMTFAGFRWRDTATVREFLFEAPNDK